MREPLHGEDGVQTLLARIDALQRERARVIVAIDGDSASGKTTLAERLAKRAGGATVVHMDDFFLRPHQRTARRLCTPGGNVDYERFLEEVLTPMRRGDAFIYRAYDCHTQALREDIRMTPEALCIVEGAYSLHPALEAAYDLRVVLSIGEAAQRARILRRNGAAMCTRFVNEWIPLEKRYAADTQLAQRCDMCIQAEEETP